MHKKLYLNEATMMSINPRLSLQISMGPVKKYLPRTNKKQFTTLEILPGPPMGKSLRYRGAFRNKDSIQSCLQSMLKREKRPALQTNSGAQSMALNGIHPEGAS